MQLRVRQDLDKSGSTTSSGYLKILSELTHSNKILAGSGTGSGYLKILSKHPHSGKILAGSTTLSGYLNPLQKISKRARYHRQGAIFF